MNAGNQIRLAACIAALHVAALSILFGLRQIGYILAASLSATLIWGAVFTLSLPRRRAGMIAGMVLGLIVQQIAYQVWKAELPGLWWPLAQFAAVQFLMAYGLWKCAA